MRATLLQPIEPTTDSLEAGLLVSLTSDHADIGSFELCPLTSSGGFEFRRVIPSGEFEFEFCAEESTADRLPLLFRNTAADEALPRTEHVWIEDLGEAGYDVLQPIPVEIKRVGLGDFEASFRVANIAISGSDQHDAYQSLVAEILDTFDVLLSEQNLGSDAAGQLRILSRYIGRA